MEVPRFSKSSKRTIIGFVEVLMDALRFEQFRFPTGCRYSMATAVPSIQVKPSGAATAIGWENGCAGASGRDQIAKRENQVSA
jgi:hypothetical protein